MPILCSQSQHLCFFEDFFVLVLYLALVLGHVALIWRHMARVEWDMLNGEAQVDR